MATTIELDEEFTARLDALSSRTGREKASLLHMLLESVIEDMEDAARADEAWERYLQGKEKTYTGAEIRADLGLDD